MEEELSNIIQNLPEEERIPYLIQCYEKGTGTLLEFTDISIKTKDYNLSVKLNLNPVWEHVLLKEDLDEKKVVELWEAITETRGTWFTFLKPHLTHLNALLFIKISSCSTYFLRYFYEELSSDEAEEIADYLASEGISYKYQVCKYLSHTTVFYEKHFLVVKMLVEKGKLNMKELVKEFAVLETFLEECDV